MNDAEDQLDRLLAEARGSGEDPPLTDALMARIVADAAAEMPRRRPAPASSRLLLAALGGWAAVSGLAAATVAGLWLGIAPPPALDALLAGDAVTVSLLPDYDTLAGEG